MEKTEPGRAPPRQHIPAIFMPVSCEARGSTKTRLSYPSGSLQDVAVWQHNLVSRLTNGAISPSLLSPKAYRCPAPQGDGEPHHAYPGGIPPFSPKAYNSLPQGRGRPASVKSGTSGRRLLQPARRKAAERTRRGYGSETVRTAGLRRRPGGTLSFCRGAVGGPGVSGQPPHALLKRRYRLPIWSW